MGMLGKQTRSGSGGFGLDDLGSLLGGEKEAARSQNPEISDILDSFGAGASTPSGTDAPSKGGLGDLLGSVLGRRDG
jgi:hypothetical protein